MFNNLLGIILSLLLGNFLPLGPETTGLGTVLQSIGIGVVVYSAFLALLFRQGRQNLDGSGSIFIQIEILGILAFLFFGLGIQRVLTSLPLPETFVALLSLFLYSIAITFYSYGTCGSWSRAFQQLHLLLPLAIPFFIFTIALDTVQLYPPFSAFFSDHSIIAALVMLSILASIITFIPAILVRAWRCQPISQENLHHRLDTLCQRARFNHSGIFVWQAMGSHPNAAILGVVSAYRYLLFSPGLLSTLSPASIEAILAHEIGHSKRHHLLFYPLIFLGMATAGALAVAYLAPVIAYAIGVAYHHYPSDFWGFFFQPLLFVIFATIIAVYFRYLFGYFSRLCEREADLYGITLGLPNTQIATALDELAYAVGQAHDVPSWHHYSLRDRITFLQHADASTPSRHHKRLVAFLMVYNVFLAIAIVLLFNTF